MCVSQELPTVWARDNCAVAQRSLRFHELLVFHRKKEKKTRRKKTRMIFHFTSFCSWNRFVRCTRSLRDAVRRSNKNARMKVARYMHEPNASLPSICFQNVANDGYWIRSQLLHYSRIKGKEKNDKRNSPFPKIEFQIADYDDPSSPFGSIIFYNLRKKKKVRSYIKIFFETKIKKNSSGYSQTYTQYNPSSLHLDRLYWSKKKKK